MKIYNGNDIIHYTKQLVSCIANLICLLLVFQRWDYLLAEIFKRWNCFCYESQQTGNIFSYKLSSQKLNISTTDSLREKSYLLLCAPNEDSDQPAHPRSLISVFVVHMRNPAALAFQNALGKILIRLRGCAG